MFHLRAAANNVVSTSVRARALSKNAITWLMTNPYGSNAQRKSQIEDAVVKFAADQGIDTRGASDGSAEVRSTEHMGTTINGVYYPNEPNHVTVNFKTKSGAHITTRHVYV